ncbi:MAG: hypothetical protein ACPL8I_05565 [Chloroflexaceae bacterium]
MSHRRPHQRRGAGIIDLGCMADTLASPPAPGRRFLRRERRQGVRARIAGGCNGPASPPDFSVVVIAV